MTWRETFAAHYALLFPAGEDPPLAAAVNAWLDSRASLCWALSSSPAELSAHLGASLGEFTAAAAEAVALAARQLARHHDHTLQYQLGFTAAQVRKIRLWARGTDAEFRAAADLAYASGRTLHVADIPGPPAVADLPPMLGHGVTVPSDAG
jgi:hypothetical protein